MSHSLHIIAQLSIVLMILGILYTYYTDTQEEEVQVVIDHVLYTIPAQDKHTVWVI